MLISDYLRYEGRVPTGARGKCEAGWTLTSAARLTRPITAETAYFKWWRRPGVEPGTTGYEPVEIPFLHRARTCLEPREGIEPSLVAILQIAAFPLRHRGMVYSLGIEPNPSGLQPDVPSKGHLLYMIEHVNRER